MGFSYQEVAQEVGKKHSFIQNRSRFLRDHSMMIGGRWSVDVQALGMTKTIKFYDYTEENWNKIMKRNFYLSYLSPVITGKIKYLAMYTFPEDVKDRTGSEITCWYYTPPLFTLPFFKNDNFEMEFWKTFEKETNENPLPPRGEKIENLDLIDIYICRYIQADLEDINLKNYTNRMKEEIGDLVDVRYSKVRARFHRLREKNVLFPVNPINLTDAFYTRFFCITSYNEIFKFMKALNRLNVITAISFGKDDKKILYIHSPYDRQDAIANILIELDNKTRIFPVTRIQINRGLPYKHYLKKKANFFKVS